jgi:adenylate cyclase
VRAKAWLGAIHSARVLEGTALPGEREAAIVLAREVIASGTDDPEALRQASDPLTQMAGDHAAALAALYRALRLNPHSAAILINLGHAHCFSNDPAPAVAYFERAIRLSPLDPYIGYMLLGLGRAHLMLGHDEEACSLLQRCVQELRIATGRIYLIHALTRLGRHAEARAEAARLLELWPKFRVGAVWRVLPENFFNPAFVTEHQQALRDAGLPE